MKKTIFAITLIILLSAGLFAVETGMNKPNGEREAGYTLLESIVVSFGELARTGKGGFDDVFPFLQNQMAELKKAKAQEQIDALFFMRYHRILEVIMLAIRPPESDPEGILDDFTIREMRKFIVDVSGVDADISSVKHRGIGVIAGAIAEEILNLHVYLDGLENREELLRKYSEWTKAPKK
jgi:hypothetical protein